MTFPEWIGIVLPLVGMAAWVKKDLHTIRNNDMAHIDAKLDEVMEGVKRLETRLESHLYWHLDESSPKTPR